jgi:hypothetical protein
MAHSFVCDNENFFPCIAITGFSSRTPRHKVGCNYHVGYLLVVLLECFPLFSGGTSIQSRSGDELIRNSSNL